MNELKRAAHALSCAEIYAHSLEMIWESYSGAVACLNGFPGTEDELQGFLEALLYIGEVGNRFRRTALDWMEADE